MPSDLDADWREHDEWWKEQNRHFLDAAIAAEARGDMVERDLSLMAYCVEEEQRLLQKEARMRSDGI